jgi:hypothetical protein
MVHALQEIHRVLVSQGTLIDVRPLAGNWPVEVVSGRTAQEAGRVSDLAAGLEDDAAANQTLAEAAKQNWFRRESEELFPFNYYWDSPDEMKAYIDEEWEDFIDISPEVWKNLRSLWTVGGAEARLRVRLNMLITRWQKAN